MRPSITFRADCTFGYNGSILENGLLGILALECTLGDVGVAARGVPEPEPLIRYYNLQHISKRALLLMHNPYAKSLIRYAQKRPQKLLRLFNMYVVEPIAQREKMDDTHVIPLASNRNRIYE